VAQTNGMMIVVNASSQAISGTVSHWSGDGSGHSSEDLPVTNQATLASSAPKAITVGSNHDDYWFWQPQGTSNQVKLQQNMDRSINVCVLITDQEVVVVTSANGIGKANLASAGKASQSA
jgi:hypothetical protein